MRLVTNGSRQTRTFGTKGEAQQFARAAEGQAVEPTESGSVRYDMWVKTWFADHSATVKPSSAFLYRKVLNHQILPELGWYSLTEITPPLIRGWQTRLTKKGLAPNTIQMARNVLSMTLKAAVRDGLIPSNPALSVRGIRVARPQITIIPEVDIDRLADAIGPRFRSLILLASYGGLRIGELGGLRLEDLDLDNQKVSVARSLTRDSKGCWAIGSPKTQNSQRVITMPKFVVRDLEQHIASGYSNGEFVFTGVEGGRLNPDYFRRVYFHEALREAGLPRIRVHDLRHTAISLWIAQGASPKLIAYLAGHGSVKAVFDIYGHLWGTEDLELAAKLDAARPSQGGSLRDGHRSAPGGPVSLL